MYVLVIHAFLPLESVIIAAHHNKVASIFVILSFIHDTSSSDRILKSKPFLLISSGFKSPIVVCFGRFE
jgi:hypothetical protein